MPARRSEARAPTETGELIRALLADGLTPGEVSRGGGHRLRSCHLRTEPQRKPSPLLPRGWPPGDCSISRFEYNLRSQDAEISPEEPSLRSGSPLDGRRPQAIKVALWHTACRRKSLCPRGGRNNAAPGFQNAYPHHTEVENVFMKFLALY